MGIIVGILALIFILDIIGGLHHKSVVNDHESLVREYDKLVDKYNAFCDKYDALNQAYTDLSRELNARRSRDGVKYGDNTYYRDERQIHMHNEVHNVRNETFNDSKDTTAQYEIGE